MTTKTIITDYQFLQLGLMKRTLGGYLDFGFFDEYGWGTSKDFGILLDDTGVDYLTSEFDTKNGDERLFVCLIGQEVAIIIERDDELTQLDSIKVGETDRDRRQEFADYFEQLTAH